MVRQTFCLLTLSKKYHHQAPRVIHQCWEVSPDRMDTVQACQFGQRRIWEAGRDLRQENQFQL